MRREHEGERPAQSLRRTDSPLGVEPGISALPPPPELSKSAPSSPCLPLSKRLPPVPARQGWPSAPAIWDTATSLELTGTSCYAIKIACLQPWSRPSGSFRAFGFVESL